MDDASTPAKFEVGRLGGRATDPVPAEEGRLRSTDNAARAFSLIAGSALAQISANAAVLREARRLEAVHQLRVGVRRLRGALSLFGPMLAGEGRERLKAELKWLARELGDARDLDVFIAETFRPAARRHRDWTGMAAFGKALLAAQTKAYDRAQTAARSARFGVLMLEAAAWTESGDWRASDDAAVVALREQRISKLAPRLLDHSLRRVTQLGRKLERLQPADRHKLRLRAKQLRYATGFFADLYTGQSAKTHKAFDRAMKDLQTALGEQTDIVAAAALAAEVSGAVGEGGIAGAAADAAVAFAAGLVVSHRAAGEAAAKRASLKAYRRFEAADRFW